jgi:hypothetical protein
MELRLSQAQLLDDSPIAATSDGDSEPLLQPVETPCGNESKLNILLLLLLPTRTH